MWSDVIQIRFAAQQRLHLTGLSCAEIEVAALAKVVLGRRPSGKPARQVSLTLGVTSACASVLMRGSPVCNQPARRAA
jgi:hypothetical protein